MVNLATLSALLRTLRHAGGPDGPPAPVSRVPPVVSLTPDDRSGADVPATTVAAWSRSQVAQATLVEREIASVPPGRREVQQPDSPGTRASDSRTPRHDVAAAATESAELDLTAGARLLQNAFRVSPGSSPMPPAITAAAPLADSPSPDANGLARSLARSVGESGLFYESHLARWIRRDYPAAALVREPQAAWSSSADPLAAIAPAVDHDAAVHEAAVQIVTRQLDALETRALVWTGELWPGQHASVAFESDEARVGDELDEDPALATGASRTRIVLDLPSLGRVEATLDLRGGKLDVTLEAENAHAHARLTEAQALLLASLAGSQVALGSFAVAIAAEER
jgi:hypothetical protein